MPNYLDAFIPSSPWGVGGGPMGMARPSLADWNRDNPLTADGRGVYNGWRSPMETEFANAPMTDDQYALLLNGQVAKKSRKLRTAGDIARAQQEAAFLDSISAGDVAGIHDAPDSARQAQLQDLLNRDYMARERGSRASMRGILFNQEMERKMAPHNLNVAKFDYAVGEGKLDRAFQREQFDATRGERAQKLAQGAQQIENMDEYRTGRLALDADRFANQAKNLEWKRSFAETQAAVKNASGNETKMANLFRDAVNKSDRMPTANLDAVFSGMAPNLTPIQIEQARGILAKRDMMADVAEMTATKYQRALSSELRNGRERGYSAGTAMRNVNEAWSKDAEARRYTIFDPESNTFAVNPVFLRAPQSRFSEAIAGSRDNGMEPIEWMEQSQRAGLPQPPTPSGFAASAGARAPEPQYTEGETLTDEEGNLWRVVNGVPQRTNLRRR